MKLLFFSFLLLVNISFNAYAQKPAPHRVKKSTAELQTKTISDIVSSYKPNENEAILRFQSTQGLFFIKNLTSFSNEELKMITNSLNQKASIKVRIDAENNILSIDTN